MPIPWTMYQTETRWADQFLLAKTEESAAGETSSDPGTVPLEEAVRIVRSIAHKTGTETIPTDEADGRTLSESIYALNDMPGFDRATMDGFAIISSDTSDTLIKPCTLTFVGSVRKGLSTTPTISNGQAVSIQTGGKLPKGADTVVLADECNVQGDRITVKCPVSPGRNIIRRDEDFRKGEPVYPAGWILRPQDIAVLASIGRIRVKVRKKPVIGIISTGRELVPSESIPKSGEVREVNSYLVTAFCKRQGAIPVRYGIIRDDAEELTNLIEQASQECDAIIVSGGSSRDEHDITAQVIHKLGKVYTEGISFAPEKRTTIGQIDSVLVIGLPGHPSATFMVLTLVVIHLLQAMKGSPNQQVYRKFVRLTDNLHASRESDRFIRVTITDDQATPVFGKAGLIHMLSQSDGIVKIPAGSKGFCAGDRVEVMIW